MAVSATPLPPILSPNRLTTITTTSTNLASSCCPKYNYNDIPLILSFPSKNSSTARKRPSIITFAQKSKTGLANDQKRQLLEQYGLNPDEFLSEPSPKTRRRKEMEKTGRGGKQVPSEGMRQPRETHKLLQVLGGKAQRKKLLSPKGMDVRPMMEVVKGAAFAMLQAAGGCPASLRPGRWLDLYSGTGSVGIEALSRGCIEIMGTTKYIKLLTPLAWSPFHTCRDITETKQTTKISSGHKRMWEGLTQNLHNIINSET